ncbi:MAG: alpha/beta hydrolase [Flavobacteriales bacterium]|nr:alpha/beta hydrolase [Flavobacteriales bacterium]MBT7687303.1 alpha/beta hydrolase [Flavobacteriales bacterium]MBT7750058.1 alpha/beta hydrolase [Flavobacteriales bacterium]NCG30742.1 alpha/beta fold hydrolase [Bacteroidota bacterium]
MSCLRLDSFLYNSDTSISEYLLDDFDGETEIQVSDEYDIADSLVHLFTLNSNLDGDIASIYTIYVGDIGRISSDTVILYLHGNADHLDRYWPRIKLLANTGHKNRFGVFAVEYRGFGLSEGTPTEEGMYVDADAAMKWLKEQGLTDDRLVVYGFSLGSAPATELTANARTLQPSKLMLENPFASDEVMVEDASGLTLPGSYFSDLEIDNGDEIQKIEEPFFWMHGTSDAFLQIGTHGETIFKNYNGSYKEAHRIEGATHTNVPFVMGYETYLDAVEKFITRP